MSTASPQDPIKRFTDDIENTEIRKRIDGVDPETQAYLDGLIEKILVDRAVEHPFLTWYAQTGDLTKEQEKQLYCECHYFFRYLPFYITGMVMKTRDERIFREILHNVVDEIGLGGDGEEIISHSQLYLSFMADLGITEQEVLDYEPLEVTTALNDGIRVLYTETEIVKALGALFGDETMSGEMVSKLNQGLAKSGYGADTRYFWTLHIDVEIGHSNGIFNAIAPYIQDDEAKKRFETGIGEFLTLVEAYWDGVDRLIRGADAAEPPKKPSNTWPFAGGF